MAALAFIQVVLAVVILGYEIIAGRLAWPPVLFLIAGLIILVLERRRRLSPTDNRQTPVRAAHLNPAVTSKSDIRRMTSD